MTYTLNAADVADLRASLHSRGRDGTGDSLGFPFIVWGEAGQEWYLHAYGRCMATSPRLEVLGACLRAERAEAGFIARLLDAAWTVEEALYDAEARAQARSRANAAAATARAQAEAREEARRASLRNVRPEQVAHITLDSLLKS